MMKALYSGVSGMRSHQTKMDVIGNNIANVNTNGYKSQRATFRDIYYQQLSNPNKPDTATNRGGTNSSQVGYGAQIASIDTIHSLSGYSPTNKSTDLYINGDGYFAVENPSGDKFYTRYGAFNFDSAGSLVDSNGNIVLGTVGATKSLGKESIKINDTNIKPLTITDYKNYKNVTISADGTITGVKLADDKIETLGQIAIATFQNPNALVLEGSSYYAASNNTGEPALYEAGLGGSGSLVTGGLEMSNVDLANEFSDMIVTQRGFQANTKIISVVDQMLEELVNLKR